MKQVPAVVLTIPIVVLLSLFQTIGIGAQDMEFTIQQIPFENVKPGKSMQILQDTTGRIWILGIERWFNTTGKKIIEVPKPINQDPDFTMRGVYAVSEEGHFYFGGDSMRIYNPYSRKVIQSIGFDPDFNLQGNRPYLFNTVFGDNQNIWAGFAPLGDSNFTGPPTVLQSQNGKGFKPIGHPQHAGIFHSQRLVVRGDMLFLAEKDSIFQYNQANERVKVHAFPSLNVMPLAALNRVEANAPVEFLHFVKSLSKDGYDRALYQLNPGDTSFKVIPLPQLNGKNISYLDKAKNQYWIRSSPFSLVQFNLINNKTINLGELLSKQFPSLTTYKDQITSLYLDHFRTLWIATNRNGIFKIKSLNEVKKTTKQSSKLLLLNLIQYNVQNDNTNYIFDYLHARANIQLPPYFKGFSTEVFLDHYAEAESHLYSWRLKGFERNWSPPSTDNLIRYDQLPPGNYTLEIQGTENGSGNIHRLDLGVNVQEYWYKRWWAYGLYVILIGGCLYLLGQVILRQQLRKVEISKQQEIDQLKTRLYTNITHEFRTPLTVIRGITENIRGHSQEKQLIQRNTKNLLRLVNQLLDLSKLDSDKLKLDKIQGDIINYLQYLSESFYSMAAEKNIRLVFYPEVKELIMDYDETRVQHIVHNLLSNAIKFTPDGGKIIFHVQELKKNKQGWLQMKVSDTGIGISEDDLPKIFNRFFQGDGSSTRQEAGTGIGLALTKDLIELMGGAISVESALGKGTDFLVLLPISREEKTSQQKQLSQLSSNATSASESNLVPALEISTFNKNSETPSLLIIEDNRDVVTYIETLLKKEYHIEVARDGQTGIEKALEMIPDIIISDVMMPKKNGYEVCQTLKGDERTSHIPIILLTAKATVEDRIEGLKGGADAYLTKPFHKEELFVRLKQLIQLRLTLQSRFGKPSLFSGIKSTTNAPSLEEQFLQKLFQVVEGRLDDPDLAVIHLCQAAKLSNTQVNRKLKALTGKTPSQFIRSIRLHKALELLQTTELNVSEIAYNVGFSDPNYFSRSFSEEFGYPPNAIRQ